MDIYKLVSAYYELGLKYKDIAYTGCPQITYTIYYLNNNFISPTATLDIQQ